MNLQDPTAETRTSAVVRAADSVVLSIQNDIQAGLIADGSALPTERDLMRRFDVSRTVIREAIGILSANGLIEKRPRYRPVVRKPGVDTAMGAMDGIVLHLLSQPGGVRNLFETRILIEAALVRNAAKAATKEDVSDLKTALDQNEAAILDVERFYDTDMAFHLVLYEISRNPVLPAILKAYKTWLAPQWSQMPRLVDRNQSNFEAHNAIFQAILMRDPDAAEAALRSHLDAAWDQVRDTFTSV
jgi:DNA-binding FadR family transcriptional regulator